MKNSVAVILPGLDFLKSSDICCKVMAARLGTYGIKTFNLTGLFSNSISYTITEISKLLDSLKSEAAIHLVGHSLGGRVLWALLGHHPDIPILSATFIATPRFRNRALYAIPTFGINRFRDPLLGWFSPRYSNYALLKRRTLSIAGSFDPGSGFLLGLQGSNDGLIQTAETLNGYTQESADYPNTHIGLLLSNRVTMDIASFMLSH